MSQSDITDRLRRWPIDPAPEPASDLMDQAADEIDRLRERPCPFVTGRVTRYCTLTPLTLTDAEREAVAWAVSAADDCQHPADDALRGLLERTDTGGK